jgi:hypothetical protein
MKPYERDYLGYKEQQCYKLPLFPSQLKLFPLPTNKFPLSPFRTIKAMKLDDMRVGYTNYMKFKKISEVTQNIFS